MTVTHWFWLIAGTAFVLLWLAATTPDPDKVVAEWGCNPGGAYTVKECK